MPSVAVVQSVFTRAPSGGVVEDVAVCTHHVRSDAPALDPVEAAQVETRLDTFWTGVRQYHPSSVRLDQYRWYQLDTSGRTMGKPARVTDRDVASTTSLSTATPPQIAISVTEITASRRRWGRFYIPGPFATSILEGAGRLATTPTDVIADLAEALYNGVNSSAGSEHFCSRPRADGSYELIGWIQVDNIMDVIRSRRWERPTLRDKRDVRAPA